ncbi:hypothetical protein JCM19236_5125 [Vibrio sp. JCM 19236]|nr:hypothetical protein JCM19236_5125 [Vibrio sp. JCM 19236]
MLFAFYDFGYGIHFSVVLFKWICIVGHLVLISILIYKLSSDVNYNFVFVTIPLITSFIYLLYGFLILNNISIVSEEEGNYLLLSNNRRYIGYLVSIALSVSLWKLFFLCENKRLWLVVSVVCSSFLFWLGGRGAFLFSLLSFWFITYLSSKFSLYLVVKTLVISMVGALISLPISIYYWTGFGRLFCMKIDEGTSLDEVGSGRISLWKDAIELILDRPLIGSGLDSFMLHVLGKNMQPHNFVLQFLVEWGIVGMLLIIAVIIFTFTYYQINKFNQLQILSILVLTNIVFNGLLDGTLYHAVPLFIATLAISALLREAQRERFTPKQQVCQNPN